MAEQFGEEIFITYDILNALPSQSFFVKAVCISDNKEVSIASALGNGFGRVKAGPGKQIIWDAKMDTKIQITGNVFFKISATLISSEEPSLAKGPVSNRESSIGDKKAQFLSLFSNSVDSYLEQVLNLVSTFETFGDNAFESRSDFLKLQAQVEKLNSAYESIFPQKENYRQNIASFWGNEVINCKSDAFISNILDRMHRVHIINFNNVVKDINTLITNTNMKKAERENKIEQVKTIIKIRTSLLREEFNIARVDRTELYASLKD